MTTRQIMSWGLVVLLATSLVTSTIAATMDAQVAQEARKFVSKPNDIKKQQLQQQPDVKQEQPTDGGFQWGNLLGLAMQLFIGGPTHGPNGASDKMDYITQLTMVLSVLGGGDNAAIDKMDGGSPVEGILTAVISYLTGSNNPDEVGVMAKQASELFGLVVTLLDALRTSFSQRSFEARSLGTTDSLADAAVAATTMLKSYIKTYETEDDICMQKYLCEANSDCVYGTGDTGYLFCQMGTYGMSFILERSTYTPFEIYNDAGRRGRVGESCQEIYNECNDV
ncbi:putative DM4/DM12 family-like protein 32 [Homarus americanus]|uniref:Putative DM4/DM12 family-like protein 32 n=1 Tax=Homarus americanus TaxID=6706 RepID=A0A8J5JJG1_HOMAM|nr:putative DM4/DM12 family-like protein 32 [Homarus americanus]